MKVRELIAKLEEIEDQESEVYLPPGLSYWKPVADVERVRKDEAGKLYPCVILASEVGS